MLSNISSQIRQKYESFTKNQLLEAEKRHEDEYVHQELMWQYKKEQIIQSWFTLLHWMHERGQYKKPLSSICSYVRNRLRVRGVSEGAIDYVTECAKDEYSIYKDPSQARHRDGFPSQRASVFENFEEMTNQVRSKQDIEKFSYAEFLESFDVFVDKDKEIRSRLRDTKDDYLEVAKQNNWKIPRLHKKSAEFPPEQFWGHSKYYFALEYFERELEILTGYVHDEKELVYKFRPDDEVSQNCVNLLNRYKDRVFYPMTKQVMTHAYATRLLLDSKGMVADAKNCQPLLDWIVTGIDKEVNAGSHGAGVLHAIETGQYIMELGKDGRSVIELPIEREFTREQCNDKIPKLLQMARNILVAHECEKAIQEWSKKTEFEVVTGDPQEFYRREMAKRGRKLPDE